MSTQQVRYQVSRGVAVVNDAIPLAIGVVRVMYGELFVYRSVGILIQPESRSAAANFGMTPTRFVRPCSRTDPWLAGGPCRLPSTVSI